LERARQVLQGIRRGVEKGTSSLVMRLFMTGPKGRCPSFVLTIFDLCS
jgi:hypothetical protein